jgi:hypothetical protein
LAGLVAARDFRNVQWNAKDRKRLRDMVTACRADYRAMGLDGAGAALDRLVAAAVIG